MMYTTFVQMWVDSGHDREFALDQRNERIKPNNRKFDSNWKINDEKQAGYVDHAKKVRKNCGSF